MKIAAVQLDIVPFGVGPEGSMWLPSEPGHWPVGSQASVLPLRDLESLPSIQQLRTANENALTEIVHVRLQQLLAFLDEHAVDLCVFPEYALPCDRETLTLLEGFSRRMIIVAGVGLPRPQGVALLREYIDEPIERSQNVVVVFGPGSRHAVSKRHPAEDERITEGTGPRLLRIATPDGSLKVGVAICKDYIVEGESGAVFEEVPDVVAIPALTNTSAPFQPGAPRDFPRAFANGARAGGSNVFAAGCSGPFVRDRLPMAIPQRAEGVIAIDWHGAPEKPTPLLKKQNSVYLRSALLARPDGAAARDVLTEMRALGDSDDLTTSFEAFPRWLRFLDDKPHLAVLRDSVDAFRLAVGDATVNAELSRLFGSHVTSADVLTPAAIKEQSLARAARELERLAAAKLPDDQYRLALRAAASYADWRQSGNLPAASDVTDQGLLVHFEIGLGAFDRDEASTTAPEQEDFLAAFLEGAPPHSQVRFVLRSIEDPATGVISAQFLMRFVGPNDEAAKEYFARLAPIARAVFVRGWSLYIPDHIEFADSCVEIRPSGEQATSEIREDLGLLVDALSASGGETALEMIASLLEDQAAPVGDDIRLGVRLFTRTGNSPLANLIGATLFPSGWTIEVTDSARAPEGRPVALRSALKVLHPPDGRIASRGVPRQRPIEIAATSDVAFPTDGATIGAATFQQPAADRRFDVRLPTESRTTHTYVLGRTGSGKTNTLKNIARHDLALESSVIVIDPHGDLFDYALRHAVGQREFVSLDFAADDVPSVNPIYLDASDEPGVLRNIDELVEAMIRSSYHENAGPRFRDIARLCLETLVAVADEAAGRYASLTDVPRLIEDLAWRNQQISRLRRLGRRDLQRRWEAHQRMKSAEQAEVEQWFVSKFSDFRRSAKFEAAVSGKPNVSLDQALARHLAILIRVPTIGIGLAASKFLGSLIVERVLRYTMERGFNEIDPPASLIVDEFQTFVGTSFVQLIPEARKFNLAVTVANQTLSQLTTFSLYEGSRSSEMERIILGNVGNFIVQSVGHIDAERVAQEFALPVHDVMRIGRHAALAALTIRGVRSAAFTVRLVDADQRPGRVSESSLRSAITSSITRASSAVPVPDISRTEIKMPSVDAVNGGVRPQDDARSGDGSFLRGWREQAQRVRQEAAEAESDAAGAGSDAAGAGSDAAGDAPVDCKPDQDADSGHAGSNVDTDWPGIGPS